MPCHPVPPGEYPLSVVPFRISTSAFHPAGRYTPDQLAAMSTKFLIVGPGLWDAFKSFTKFNQNTGIPVTFYVSYSNGVQKLEARGMKTPAQQRAFWATFLDLLAVDAYQI